MRFTEHEMTAALTGAAKATLAAQRKDVRKGKVDIEDAWQQLGRLERFKLLDALGSQVLPVMVALPDVEVPTGSRPSFTDAQVTEAVQAQLGEGAGGRVRRKVLLAARTALVKTALAHVPPRSDPDTFTVPDHL